MGVTIRQIAAELGVSAPTVSHILTGRGRFSDQTRQRVLEAAQRMGYRPNAAARAMRQRRSRHVGVLVSLNPRAPQGAPQNYGAILGLNDGLQQADLILSMLRPGDMIDPAGKLPPILREQLLEALVVLNAYESAKLLEVQRLVPRIIWADTGRWADVDCIRPDEAEAGRLAAAALVRGGARRMVMLASNRPESGLHYSAVEREAGAAEVVRKAGIDLQIIPWALHWSSDLDQLLTPHLKPGVGVLAYDVRRARLVQKVAMDQRLRPGLDFGLASAESMYEAQTMWPELTSAGFDRYSFGRAVAEMVVEKLATSEQDSIGAAQAKSRLFPCALHEGASSNCEAR